MVFEGLRKDYECHQYGQIDSLFELPTQLLRHRRQALKIRFFSPQEDVLKLMS